MKVRIDAVEEHCVCFFTQYSIYVLYRCLLFSFQFQRLLEEAAVEKVRLVMELQYVIFLVLDISDGVHE